MVVQILFQFCSRKMSILTLSNPVVARLTLGPRRLIRDRILCGFCLRVGGNSKTFMVATSSNGRQVRITLGRWPHLDTDTARAAAATILKSCRDGQLPIKASSAVLPTLKECLTLYVQAKQVKASSQKRYDSVLRIHFGNWYELSIAQLDGPAFHEHCHSFAQSKGAAVVEVGKGLIGAMLKYINAVYQLQLNNPFTKLSAAGLMPAKAEPRERKLQDTALPDWYSAIHKLPDAQRDYLMLVALTGLRRDECVNISIEDVDLSQLVLTIPETKNGVQHTLPITSEMQKILKRRMESCAPEQRLFANVSAEHVAEMAHRKGAPKFMVHDLRKLLATTGARIGIDDAHLKRIVNHKAKRSDVLNAHYVRLDTNDILDALERIQTSILKKMAA